MNFKRFVSILIAGMLFSTTLAVEIPVLDMPEAWSKEAVSTAVEEGLLTEANGLIRPEDKLTRAEMAEGIVNAFGATIGVDLKGYVDVPLDKEYYDDISKAVAMEILTGYGNGELKPEGNITREEMFTVLYNALHMEPGNIEALDRFKDKDTVSDWAKEITARMVESKYIVGDPEGNLNPQSNITREEFAQVMKNIFDDYYKTAGTYTNLNLKNIIISSEDVIIKESVITGDLVIAEGVGKGGVTLENVIVLGRTIVRGGSNNAVKLTNGSKLSGNVIVNNKNDKVKILNEKSSITNVILNTEATLCGDFEKVSVNKAIPVEVLGNINEVVINEKTDIDIKEGIVEKITVNETASGTKIKGKGTVAEVSANANDIVVTTSKTQVTAGENTTGVLAGSKKVEAGKSVKTSSGGGGGGGGGSSGGGSSGGGSSGGGSSGGGGGSSSSNKVTLPDLILTDIQNGGKIDLGPNYKEFKIMFLTKGASEEVSYTPFTRYLTPQKSSSAIGWNEEFTYAVKVQYNDQEKTLTIKEEIEQLFIEVERNKLIPSEDLISSYEYRNQHEDGYEDFEDKTVSIKSTMYIRKKATDTKLSSLPIEVNRIISDIDSEYVYLKDDYDNYQVAYSNNKLDFLKEEIWKEISENKEDWQAGKTVLYDDEEEAIIVDEVYGYSETTSPMYFALKQKDNPRVIHIVRVKEIAEVEEIKDEEGYHTAIRVGEDFNKYFYNVKFTNGTTYTNRTFESRELVLPADAEVEIYKKGDISSDVYKVNYDFKEKVVEMPDFKLDTKYALIYLGEDSEGYTYSYDMYNWYEPTEIGYIELENSTGRFWYRGTETYAYANRDYIMIKAENDEIKTISLNKHNQELPELKVDYQDCTIKIDNSTLYEYIKIIPDEGVWETPTKENKYLNFDEGDIIIIRLKSTESLLPSTSQMISFGTYENGYGLLTYNGSYYARVLVPEGYSRRLYHHSDYISKVNSGDFISFGTVDGALYKTKTLISKNIVQAEDSEDLETYVDEDLLETIDLDCEFLGDIKVKKCNNTALELVNGKKYDLAQDYVIYDLENREIADKIDEGDYVLGIGNNEEFSVVIIVKNATESSIYGILLETDEIQYGSDEIKYTAKIFVEGENIEFECSEIFYETFNEGDFIKINVIGDFIEDATALISADILEAEVDEDIADYVDEIYWEEFKLEFDAVELGELQISKFGGKKVNFGSDMARISPDRIIYGLADKVMLDEIEVGDFILVASINENEEYQIIVVLGHDDLQEDEEDSQYREALEAAINEVVDLGIMSYDQDGNFNEDDDITRAQAAAILTNLLGGLNEYEFDDESVFSDVSESHWAKKEINFMFEKDIMNGFPDGTFRPNEIFTGNQIITSIIRILGWGDIANQMGTWPSAHISVAARLGILENLAEVSHYNATRGNAAIMISNALDVEIWDTGTTLREKYFSDSIPPEDDTNPDDTTPDDTIPDGEIVTLPNDWYKGYANYNEITSIKFVDNYVETGGEAEIWQADEDKKINCYLTGTELTICANGEIFAPEDSSGLFKNFSKLTEIQGLELLNTSNVTNMHGMFEGCDELKSIDISSFDTSNVEDMSYLFSECESITSINLTNLDTSNVKDMSHMFYLCTEIGNIDISSFDTTNVTDMSAMFGFCKKLKAIDLSALNTPNVNNTSAMFVHCGDLKTIKLSSFNSGKIENMHQMFYECYDIESLDVSLINTESVQDMSDMFYGMHRLAEVKTGENFEFKGNTGFLPAPDKKYILGATGRWYDSEGNSYVLQEVPDKVNATYYAVPPSVVEEEFTYDELETLMTQINLEAGIDKGLSFYTEITPEDSEEYLGISSDEFMCQVAGAYEALTMPNAYSFCLVKVQDNDFEDREVVIGEIIDCDKYDGYLVIEDDNEDEYIIMDDYKSEYDEGDENYYFDDNTKFYYNGTPMTYHGISSNSYLYKENNYLRIVLDGEYIERIDVASTKSMYDSVGEIAHDIFTDCNPRKWIMISAEYVLVATKDNYIMLVMSTEEDCSNWLEGFEAVLGEADDIFRKDLELDDEEEESEEDVNPPVELTPYEELLALMEQISTEAEVELTDASYLEITSEESEDYLGITADEFGDSIEVAGAYESETTPDMFCLIKVKDGVNTSDIAQAIFDNCDPYRWDGMSASYIRISCGYSSEYNDYILLGMSTNQNCRKWMLALANICSSSIVIVPWQKDVRYEELEALIIQVSEFVGFDFTSELDKPDTENDWLDFDDIENDLESYVAYVSDEEIFFMAKLSGEPDDDMLEIIFNNCDPEAVSAEYVLAAQKGSYITLSMSTEENCFTWLNSFKEVIEGETTSVIRKDMEEEPIEETVEEEENSGEETTLETE